MNLIKKKKIYEEYQLIKDAQGYTKLVKSIPFYWNLSQTSQNISNQIHKFNAGDKCFSNLGKVVKWRDEGGNIAHVCIFILKIRLCALNISFNFYSYL